MARIIALILLLVHVNTTMFFPCVDADGPPAIGMHRDDMNSVFELVYEGILGHKDATPDNKENNTSRFLHSVASHRYVAPARIVIITQEPPAIIADGTVSYPITPEHSLLSAVHDITVPPPKA